MANYTIKGKNPRTVSRENFVSQHDENAPIFDYAKIGSLQRIADALERIATVLECHRCRGAADAIIRMDKRMAKRSPLGPRRRP